VRIRRWVVAGAVIAALAPATQAAAQQPEPSVVDPNLAVKPVVGGLTQPIGVAFLGRDDMLVLEKGTGQVKRVEGGAVTGTVLDLAVNSASERGLLGIALHPRFEHNGFVYLFWTESSTGADSNQLADVEQLGHRVDRFKWDGSTLTYDKTLIRLRSFQADANQPLRGNHNGGILRFGPDRKLYVIMGDQGRRGWFQNLVKGPFGDGSPDDQFGGPKPDNAHMSGMILRLNDDGSTPHDNPFSLVGAAIGGEVGANIRRTYAYGLRNSFGMAFDPFSGDLWEQENGDDSFSEINRVERGFNSGWVQIMGPPERVREFKAIETDRTAPRPDAPNGYYGLQQVRWPPENIADSPREALSRLFRLPFSRYSPPELSWKYEVGPGGIGFLDSSRLGNDYRGDLFTGGSTARLEGGHLFRIELTRDRKQVESDDPRLEDRVADNVQKWEITESESLLFGRNFGVVTDIETAPNGNLLVVSLDRGTVYEIGRS
jgi:glucose/arabinose dehydrogenase